MSVLSIQPTFQFSYFRFLIHIPHYFLQKYDFPLAFPNILPIFAMRYIL